MTTVRVSTAAWAGRLRARLAQAARAAWAAVFRASAPIAAVRSGKEVKGARDIGGKVLRGAVIAAWLASSANAAAANAVTYLIGDKATVQQLYPDASWLPKEYQAPYPDLARTIEHYTQQSLERDGVRNPQVKVSFVPRDGAEHVQVSITPANAVTKRYAQVHPAFLDRVHGQAALRAAQACMKSDSPTKCWDPKPRPGQPWAFYLPLGMAMAKNQSIMFMDYPPVPALLARDYLNNFTLCRWTQVLNGAGVRDYLPLQAIVDARPIAAPGAGEDALMPDPNLWFDTATGAPYLTPMLQLRTTPAAAAAQKMLPVAVFGSSPRKAWGSIVGQSSLKVLDVGESRIGGEKRATPWIVTNHPDVTTYNCCPGDPSAKCQPSSGGMSNQELLASEQKDFVAACWIKTMSAGKPPSAAAAKQQCEARWVGKPNAADRQTLCVQAKLDNNNRDARCGNFEEAWNYCAANGANACASFDCKYDKAKVRLPLPPVAQRPYSAEQNCADRKY